MSSGKIDCLLKLHMEIGKYFCEVDELDVCVNGVFLPPDSQPRFDVVFAGVNPSTASKKSKTMDELGNWNTSQTDKLFQKYLVEHGLEGCYATDFSHFGRAETKTDKISNEELKKHSDFFKREIEIIQPKIIACFGQKTYDLVKEIIHDGKIQVIKLWHPGAAKQGHGIKKLKQNWDKKFQKIKKEIN